MFGMDQWNFLAYALLINYMEENKKLFGRILATIFPKYGPLYHVSRLPDLHSGGDRGSTGTVHQN